MKGLRTVFLTIMILVFAVDIMSALSINIKNKLNNKLSLKLTEGRTVTLLPRGVVTVSEQDLDTPQLKALIQNGSVVIVSLNDKSGSSGSEGQNSSKKN